MAKKRGTSRPDRWSAAHQKAETIRDQIKQLADDELAPALADLAEIQSEYEEWRDNLPENMASSPLGEKLDEVIGLDLQSVAGDPMSDWTATDDVIEECGVIDLPRGFGRD